MLPGNTYTFPGITLRRKAKWGKGGCDGLSALPGLPSPLLLLLNDSGDERSILRTGKRQMPPIIQQG